MIAIELRTVNCFVCGLPIAPGFRVDSGHMRATDCNGSYIGVMTGYHSNEWENGSCYRAADEWKDEEGSEQGCRGLFRKELGVELDEQSICEAPFIDVKKRDTRWR